MTGHEFTGTVVSAGSGVRSLSPGDRVMSAFTTSCGSCFYCQRGLTCRCEHSQGAACFGWVSAGGGGLQGAHAQFIKVPLADGTLLKVGFGAGRHTVSEGVNRVVHARLHTHMHIYLHTHTHILAPPPTLIMHPHQLC